MSSSGTYKIRPAGRHILTIGRDLIQDCYAAVVELERDVSVRCALCARPSVRGQYRLLTGRRVWVCLNCSTGCSRIEGPGICSDCLQNGR
ncbi:MAG: hypothetical protein RBR16_07835 [Syntrophus sp. (in: bacteria)]|nr:hypothetical protein [Syntrophus sp. (in: bacteria)]